MYLIYPLIYFIQGLVGILKLDPLSMTNKVLDYAGGVTGPLTQVGIGIGSIFLLIVIFVYISQILDGGKFQVKMLVPLLIYVCVCNFGIISSPVVSFVVTIQRQCSDALSSAKKSTFNAVAAKYGVEKEGDVNSYFDMFIAVGKSKRKDDPLSEKMHYYWENSTESADSGTSDSSTTPVGAAVDNPTKLDSWWSRVKESVAEITETGKNLFNKIFVEWIYEGFLTDPGSAVIFGLGGIVTQLVNWVSMLLEIVIQAMGAVMTGVIVAFGPITWGFAVWPGNTRTLGAWAIRLCQFALYSPIVCLICHFFNMLIMDLCFGLRAGFIATDISSFIEASESIFMLLAMLLGLLACLLSVPTIASMIIEGAQGAVTLSQGLQTAAGMFSNVTMIGEHFRDKQQLDASTMQMQQLNAIGEKLGASMPSIEGFSGGKK